MPIALAIAHIDVTRRKKHIIYTATFSGNYATGGDTLNFSTATNPKLLPAAFPSTAPQYINIQGDAGGTPGEAVIGTTNANSKLKLFSSPNTELSAGAYNAAVTGDVNIQIEAVWPVGK